MKTLYNSVGLDFHKQKMVSVSFNIFYQVRVILLVSDFSRFTFNILASVVLNFNSQNVALHIAQHYGQPVSRVHESGINIS